MLEIEKLTSGYGKKTVLNGVSAKLGLGKLISVVGPNGSGKSTLLKTINGIIPAFSGDIAIDGESLLSLKRQEIAKKIAYLSQGKAVPDMTVEQLVLHGRFPNLNYPRRYTENDRFIVKSVLEQLGISDYASKALPTLSGGLCQITYVAMSLAQNTEYILLDEPTTYLDISHQLELMRILRELAYGGKGIISVMHDLTLAFTFSDEIIVINNGEIVMQGSPEEVCASGVIKSVFGVGLSYSDGDFKIEYDILKNTHKP